MLSRGRKLEKKIIKTLTVSVHRFQTVKEASDERRGARTRTRDTLAAKASDDHPVSTLRHAASLQLCKLLKAPVSTLCQNVSRR